MKNAQKRYFIELLKKYREKRATAEEVKFLEAYYEVFEAAEDRISDENELEYLGFRDRMKAAVDLEISVAESKPGSGGVMRKLNRSWIKYSAAIVVLALSVSLFYLNQKGTVQQANIDQGIQPGSNKAVLTLANGQKIELDNAAHGEIARQSGISISKTADGQIVYTAVAAPDVNTAMVFRNTISTPKGGQYKVVLPDGTTVLLNAASALSYPTAFVGPERLVELEGEAYFEVSKNKDMPFRVRSGPQTVEVLGTHFSISAYSDEDAIRTTLAEGSVMVFSARHSVQISPGEQTVLNRGGNGTIYKRNVSIEKELAWKDGLFSFENDDLSTVMRSIARWYNVDVHYNGDVPDINFTGEIFRNAKLTEVFKILELNNVHVELRNKTILVSYEGDSSKEHHP